MKTAQQVWEEAYPDRRKWEALDQDTRGEWERVVRVAQEVQRVSDLCGRWEMHAVGFQKINREWQRGYAAALRECAKTLRHETNITQP